MWFGKWAKIVSSNEHKIPTKCHILGETYTAVYMKANSQDKISDKRTAKEARQYKWNHKNDTVIYECDISSENKSQFNTIICDRHHTCGNVIKHLKRAYYVGGKHM